MTRDEILEIAEQHACLLLGGLRREVGDDVACVFERLVGALVLRCLSRSGDTAAANINSMLTTAAWQLEPRG
jgi:hypothetical protein